MGTKLFLLCSRFHAHKSVLKTAARLMIQGPEYMISTKNCASEVKLTCFKLPF